MHRSPRLVRADALAVDAADLMEQHRITSVLVVDEAGRAGGRAQLQRPDAGEGDLMAMPPALALSFPPELLLRAQGPGLGMKAAIFDVDGVLTDGRLYIGEHGETVKAFSTLDGHGLKLLQQGGIEPVVITGRDSPAVRRRVADLGPGRTRSTARATSWPRPRRCWPRWAWTGPRWPRSATTGPTCRCWRAPASPARRPTPTPK